MSENIDILYLAWNRREYTEVTFELMLENTDWDRVGFLYVYDDGSTDGTAGYLRHKINGGMPVPTSLIHLGHHSPVAVMNHYLDHTKHDLFAKIDNDIALPPGWLEAMDSVMEANPGLDLLGMEAGRTELAGRDGAPWDGTYTWVDCSHIGGVGLMRVPAFTTRERPRARGRFGFTSWQHEHEPKRGWIVPDLLVPQLDRVPVEPWASLSQSYCARGWQRHWPSMDPDWAAPYYDWIPNG